MVLHEDVESQLARMEKRRQQLLATSPSLWTLIVYGLRLITGRVGARPTL